ncbi:GEM-like protein 5 [Nymphaea thermarum]|nr:GEM-like protein 5 [Nymphaea thermarum]
MAAQQTEPSVGRDEQQLLHGDQRWGTQVMGAPAEPSAHPQNQKAAHWAPVAGEDLQEQQQQQRAPYPYVVQSPVQKPNSAMDTALHKFNKWSKKAEALASNIWLNLRTAPSMSEAAWGKVSLTTKALTEGGFESLYKQTFQSEPAEKLKKTFACYLSTSTGPVAGTLYLSNVKIAFCSDCPLTFTAPSGQEAWSYYKVVIPLEKVEQINPVRSNKDPGEERYIQVAAMDGHDFWFMGFVSYDKALTHLLDTRSEIAAAAAASQQMPSS